MNTNFPSISQSPTHVLLNVDYSCLHSTAWKLNANNNNDYNPIFSSNTEIISSGLSGTTSWTIVFNQIPYYYYNFTKSVISALNSRPKASTDFALGRTTATTNNLYQFGSNIGYIASPCVLGYWPPGPVCPAATVKTVSFNIKPAIESSTGNLSKLM